MQKNIFLFTCLIVYGMGAESQVIARPSFGLRAGINFQNINGKDENGDKLTNKMIPAVHFGVNAELPIATEF
jgi:hypothetical protein